MNKVIKKYVPAFALFIILILTSMNINSSSKEKTSNKGLSATHTVISKRYATVPHLTTNDVIKMDKNSYVIFDVREKDEYAVSHIKNAIQVDPSIDTSSFYKKYAQQIKDKTIIVYCSVGARSSKLAANLLDANKDELKIYNLERGIFGWHNESRPLFQTSHSTEFIHPYNSIWGRMVNRAKLKRYKPE